MARYDSPQVRSEAPRDLPLPAWAVGSQGRARLCGPPANLDMAAGVSLKRGPGGRLVPWDSKAH